MAARMRPKIMTSDWMHIIRPAFQTVQSEREFVPLEDRNKI